MSEKKHAKIKKILLFCFIMLFALCVYAYAIFLSYNNGAISAVYEAGPVSEQYIPLYDGVIITQEFDSNSKLLRGVTLRFSYEDGSLESGMILLTLTDKTTGDVLATSSLSTMNLNNTGENCFGFDRKLQVAGRKLVISISTSQISEEQNLKLVTSDAMQKDEPCIALGTISAGVDSFFIIQNVAYILLIVLLAVTFIYFVRSDGKQRHLEYLYLPIGIVMGFIFSIMIPVASVPDETLHMNIAYDLSNSMMGIESPDGSLTMRRSDAEFYFKSVELTRMDYNNEYKNLFAKAGDTELVSTGVKVTQTNEFLYFFAALGITIGRLLGSGTVLMYLIGRLLNMLVFVLAVYYAIKKIPFGKAVVFVWALLPIMLQQTASYSYDCLINALCILVIAITINLMYGTVYEIKRSESRDEKLPKWLRILLQPKVIILIICCILLIPCKGHAFLPIVAFPLMLLPAFIKKHCERISSIRKNIKSWLKWCVGICFVVIVLGVIAIGFRIIMRLLATSDAENYISWANQSGYTIGYLLKNPVKLIAILVNTLFVNGDRYLKQMLGGSLGWLDINVPFIFVMPFLFLLVFAALRKNNEIQPITIGQKAWMWIVFVGICGFAAAGMLLYWTPLSLNYIAGLQGRYFLPALVLLVIPLRTKKTSVGENTDLICIYSALFMYLFIFTSVFDCAT